MALRFELVRTDRASQARLGKIHTSHGEIETPVFMPVGTRAAVKTLTSQHLLALDAPIILGNTYHLMLRPGGALIERAGGLHRFMNWPRAILTDSGGFQVFSLSSLNKVTDQGVHFRSHIDGSKHFLGPLESMQIQRELGSDIVMAFDQCVPYPATREQVLRGVERTYAWARQCRDFELREHQSLFGIVQGGVYPDLRETSVAGLTELPFDGFAIGGLSVGEPAEMMNAMLDVVVPKLPITAPRYLMGVGTPRNLIEAVMRGVDMFDCVMPTRNARNGTAFTWEGKMQIKAARYAEDFSPIDAQVASEASSFSRAYIRHLLQVDEITGLTLLTIHNLAFYLDFMRQLRQAIRDEKVAEFYHKVCAVYP